MKISITHTDPAKAMNDWQIEARIAQLERRISEIQWLVDHEPDTLTPMIVRERLELSRERNHLYYERVTRLFDYAKHLLNEHQEQPAQQWTIKVNKNYQP